MVQPAAPASRHAEVSALVRAAAAGKHRPVYLLTGEPYETRAAAHALIEALVAEAQRAFNVEIYEGRTTPLSTVLDSVRTPGFLPGTKVIWVRESTLFLSGEKRSEIAAAMFAAWTDGREAEAAEKLLTLVGMAGWSQEQFLAARWPALPKTRVRETVGLDPQADQLAALEGIHRACVVRNLRVSGYQDDSGAVLEFLEGGMPPRTVMLFTASAVDARKRLFKRVSEIGAVLNLATARERSGALARASVDDVVAHAMRAHGKELADDAHQLVVRRAGSDPAMLSMELEKLCLYVGARRTITADDVRAAFRDMAESWIFDFTAALTSRQLERALPLLRGLLEQGEPPLRLLAMIAREVRMLLLARESLDADLRGAWTRDLQFNAFQSRVLPRIDAATRQAFGNSHPFVLYRRFQDAARIDVRALRTALVQLSGLDLRLKSSRGDPALLLEAFVLGWCRAPRSRVAETKRAAPRFPGPAVV